ncbi:MAG TPA: glutathione S-transferase family protein [Burkholderiaceae bacterium]|nr:glutathione S-transferase family protein [Burkholderiaceae bacterium]
MDELVLVSHALCPYVQRVAIALHEKGTPFRRVDVDLANKPDWFVAMSPLAKTPLLQVANNGDAAVLFESAVILEYLEETIAPPLHPAAPLRRADHRGWIEFASSVLNDVAGLYSAADPTAFAAKRAALRAKFERVETRLGARQASGPLFDGPLFSLVDAAFAPVFRYWAVFDEFASFGTFDGLSKVQAWRAALARRESVRRAALPDYAARLRAFLEARPYFSTNARSIT